MTARDERILLKAVASRRDGAWVSDIRRQIPNTSQVRILVGLQRLVEQGLVREEPGAYQMARYTLTLNGNYRLRRPPPRSYARAA